MPFIGKREKRYIRGHLAGVAHTTLDPRGPGVVRIHLIPPREQSAKKPSFVVLLNGQTILPIGISWAILLSAFIEAVNRFDGQEMPEAEWEGVIRETVAAAAQVYPRVKQEAIKFDILKIINVLLAIARGEAPDVDIGTLPLFHYSRQMRAPFRMDLMISATDRDGQWACNQKCIHCYAAGQMLSDREELPTDAWETIISKLREIGIPQLTFTGGEPTLRKDLCKLVAASKWFVTRLNTNGVLLTEELCASLADAELDSIQITLYSHDSKLHNVLVGAENWSHTVNGIRNAVAAGINASVNTPLCTLNADYQGTLRYINTLGIRYVSCSGLIPAGQAASESSARMQLDPTRLEEILRDAFDYCTANGMEISFTSPGCVNDNVLHKIGFTSTPSCGAALSNMAIAPNGDVVPCQSWLSDEPLGNILTMPWHGIWDSRRCRDIRADSARMEGKCSLRDKQEGDAK